MTISDLDAGPSASEFVTVGREYVHYYVGDQALITVDEKQTFVTTFWGHELEWGNDNPGLASQFTVQQKRKAVTLQLKNAGTLNFRMGASPGMSSRTVQFNFQAT